MATLTITNLPLLASLRAGKCQWCCQRAVDHVHHVKHRGRGDGKRVDASINLLPLCLPCHGAIHECEADPVWGDPGKTMLDLEWEIIAKREGTSPGAIHCVLDLLLRIDRKNVRRTHGNRLLAEEVRELDAGALELFKRVCVEASLLLEVA